MSPRFRFGAIDADGERIHVHVTVTIAGVWEHPIVVALKEDDAHKLVSKFQTAIAKLNRTRLGGGSGSASDG